MQRLVPLMLFATLLCLGACGGKAGSPVAAGSPQLPASAADIPFPPPSARAADPPPAHTASYLPSDLLLEAETYSLSPAHAQVIPSLAGLSFQPLQAPSGGFAGCAYATFSFHIPDYGGNRLLTLNYATPPQDNASVYVAFANWDKQRWDWYALRPNLTVIPPSFEPYFQANGTLNVCVLQTGAGGSDLDSLRIGSLPPDAQLSMSPRYGFVPLAVSFDASASSDPDGSIAEYRWDPEGDGNFDISSGSNPVQAFTYSTPLSADAAVRVIDNKGVYAEARLAMNAVDGITFTYGAANIEESISSVLVTQAGDLILTGTEGPHHSSYNVMNCHVRADGSTVAAAAWNGSGSDFASAAAIGSDQMVYLAGYSPSLGGGLNNALLQQWDQQGHLLWSRTCWQADCYLTFSDIALSSDTIYVCGTFTPSVLPPDISRSYGLVAAFDYSGNLLWDTSLIAVGSCTLSGISLYSPLLTGTPELRVCGSYDTNFVDDGAQRDIDLFYARLTLAGDVLEGLTLGNDSDDERASGIVNVSSKTNLRTFICGYSDPPDFGSRSSLVGIPGGAVTTVENFGELISGIDLCGRSGAPTLLAARSTGVNGSLGLARFDSAVSLLASSELGSAPDGNVSPTDISNYSSGIVCSASVFGETPVASALDLGTSASALSWESVSLPAGHPPLTFTDNDLSVSALSFAANNVYPNFEFEGLVHIRAF